jgi:hypothetical protein
LLSAEVERGAEIPYAFEEHGAPGRPPLYEYRPLIRSFVGARAERLARGEDARLAVEELRREPGAAIFARAHAGTKATDEDALVRTVLLPLLARTAERSGGFDWDDDAFDGAYAELEHALFGGRRSYAALAPLIGLSSGVRSDLGRGVRVRPAVAGELAQYWPEASGLLPPDFGREADRMCVLELEQTLPPKASEPPDAPGELGDAVTVLRLATAAPVSAGPVLFERLDWRPLGIRPLLPISATQPPGEASKLDRFRAALARSLMERISGADADPELAEALDLWELALFQEDPSRSEQLRTALMAVLGSGDGLWAAALRAALLLGQTPRERAEAMRALRALARGDRADAKTRDLLRRTFVEVLLQTERERLIQDLDGAALGLRPRPAIAPIAGVAS